MALVPKRSFPQMVMLALFLAAASDSGIAAEKKPGGFFGGLKGLFSKKEEPPENPRFEKIRSKVHLDLNKYRELFKQNRYREAKELLAGTLDLCQKNNGDAELDTAYVRTQMGITDMRLGKYDGVEELLQRSLEIRHEKLGPDNYFTAETFQALGLYYRDKADWGKSLKFYQKAFAGISKAKGRDSLETAYVASALGQAQRNVGQFAEAGESWGLTLAIFEKDPLRNARDIAVNLSSMAEVARSLGVREKLLQRALNILRQAGNQDSREYASILADFASTNVAQGRPQLAEEKFLEAIRIMRKSIGDKHPLAGNVLSRAANFYQSVLNDYAKAEELSRSALASYDKTFGSRHPLTIIGSVNLAMCMFENGNARGTEIMRVTALLMFGQPSSSTRGLAYLILDPKLQTIDGIPDYIKAEFFNAIGVTLSESANRMGQESKSQRDAREVRLILDASTAAYNKALKFAKTKSSRSRILYNQAYAFIDEHPRKAEPHLLEYLKIKESSYGFSSPKLTSVLASLVSVYAELGQTKEADRYASRLMVCEESKHSLLLSFTTERQREATLSDSARYNHFVRAGTPDLLAEFVLKSKGMILDSILEEKAFLQTERSPELERLKAELLKSEANLRLLGGNKRPNYPLAEFGGKKMTEEAVLVHLADLKKRITLEFSKMNPTRKLFRFEVSDVQKALGPETVLLEFISFDQKVDRFSWQRRYGVIVIPFLDSDRPVKWIDLGVAADVDAEIASLRKILSTQGAIGGKKTLAGLFASLASPVLEHLPDQVNTLIISPDAGLNFLPYGCLLGSKDRFLAEDYDVLYVSSGRDLLDSESLRENPNRKICIFANPDFKGTPHEVPASVRDHDLIASAERWRNLSFEALPGTAAEAEALSAVARKQKLGVSTFSGLDASESRLRETKSPFILHLATHGFFLAGKSSERKRNPLSRQYAMDNPMNRSGILLAGAERSRDAYLRGDKSGSFNDGVLTAEEVKDLDLRGTWLSVLSACDTGVGQVLAGEGILGLRRSFVQSGTRNLLVTLWPVSDSFTKDFMVSFYEEGLKTGNAPRAMAKVQKDWLVKLREERSIGQAVKLAGPFVLTFRGGLN